MIDKLNKEHLSQLILPEERRILKKISMFSDTLADAAEKLEPHRLINYCQDLIACFHGYFTKYKNHAVFQNLGIFIMKGRELRLT